MSKESITTAEYEELAFNASHAGKWTDTIRTGILQGFTAPTGYMLFESIKNRSFVEFLLAVGASALSFYPGLKSLGSTSDRRAEALKKLSGSNEYPYEELGISNEKYKKLHLKKSPFFNSDLERLKICSAFTGIIGYAMISAIENNDWKTASVAGGLFLFFTAQNLMVGMYSDRRREVLKKVLRGYKA